MAAGAGFLNATDWIILAVLAGFLLGALALHVCFLFTLMRCLARVDERNREFTPGLVWLAIIPLFNHIWYLIMIPKVTASLRNEWRDRDWFMQKEDFGHQLGMTYAIGTLITACASVAASSGGWSCIVLIAQLVFFGIWIAYWLRIAGFSRRLGGPRPPGDEFADYDDEFRPREPEAPRRDNSDVQDSKPKPHDEEWPPPEAVDE